MKVDDRTASEVYEAAEKLKAEVSLGAAKRKKAKKLPEK